MIAPPATTDRLPATIAPRSTPLISVIFTVVPFARIVPKLFVLFVRVTLPVLTKFAVPDETFAEPLCVMAPPAFTVRPVAIVVPRIKPFTSVIETVVPLATTVPKSFD